MRNMTGRAKMVMAGLAVGMGIAFLLVAVAAKGNLRGWGLAAVIVLSVLSGLGGWMVGLQMRIRLERDKVWLQGYKEGREGSCLVQKTMAIGILER